MDESGASLVRSKRSFRLFASPINEGILAGCVVYVVTTLPLALGYWIVPALFTEAINAVPRNNLHAGPVEPRSWWAIFVKSLPIVVSVIAAIMLPHRIRVQSPVGPAHSAMRTCATGWTLAITWLLTIACAIVWDFAFHGMQEGKFARRTDAENLGLSAFYFGTYTGIPLTAVLIPLPRFATFISSLDCATEHGVNVHVLLGHVLTFMSAVHGFLYMGAFAAMNKSRKIVEFNEKWVNNAAGTAALAFLLVLWVMALEPARRRAFATFRVLHIVLAVGFVIAASMHWKFMWIYVLPGGVLLMADFAIRTVAGLSNPVPVTIVTHGGGNLLAIAIPSVPLSPAVRCSGGATARIALAAHSVKAHSGWHPFTAILSERGSHWIMHARVSRGSGWTGRAALEASRGNVAGAFVHGPYGGINASWLLNECNEGVLMLCAGTGITPILSMLAAALWEISTDEENGLPLPPQLVWSIQEPRDARAIMQCHPSVFEWIFKYNRLRVVCTSTSDTASSCEAASDAPMKLPAANESLYRSPPRALSVGASWLGATIAIIVYEGIYNDWRVYNEREEPIPVTQQGWFTGLMFMFIPHLIAYTAALGVILVWHWYTSTLGALSSSRSKCAYTPSVTGANNGVAIDEIWNTVCVTGNRVDFETEVNAIAKEASHAHQKRACMIVSGPRHFRRAAKLACRSSPPDLPQVRYSSFSFEL